MARTHPLDNAAPWGRVPIYDLSDLHPDERAIVEKAYNVRRCYYRFGIRRWLRGQCPSGLGGLGLFRHGAESHGADMPGIFSYVVIAEFSMHLCLPLYL